MKKIILLLVTLLPFSVVAQIQTKYLQTNELSEKGVFRTEEGTDFKAKKEIKVDVAQLLLEDEQEIDSGLPFRFGKAVDVDYTLLIVRLILIVPKETAIRTCQMG